MRPGRRGLPGGKNDDRAVPVDDDQPGEERAVRALELDAWRWPGHLAQPVDERLGPLRATGAATELFQDDVADDFSDYDDGQIASETTATRRPAIAAAAPFFVLSAVRTRMMYGTLALGFEEGEGVDGMGMERLLVRPRGAVEWTRMRGRSEGQAGAAPPRWLATSP